MKLHWVGLAALVALAPPAAGARSLGALDFEPCVLTTPGSAASVEAYCTTVQAPEDHDRPDGRRIDLALAWVPARDSAEADPVFMLAGGPGQGARESYPGAAPAFSEVRRKRHILLLDQRGTGGSNPLVCRMGDAMEALDSVDVEAWTDMARDCLAEIGERADPAFYTTTDAIRDLDLVREQIGAETVNLVGISYGTRVAQQYAARFPEHTRSVVIDGIVPNDLVLGSEHAANLETALEQHFDGCRNDAACREALGDPRALLDRVLAQADGDEAPVVRYRDAVTHELHEERLGRGHVVTVVRMYAYAPHTASLLPLVLAEAARGQPEALMAQARMMTRSLDEQINHGMQLSVMCAEDVDEMSVREADADSVLGNLLVEVSQAQCAVWPRGQRPEGFRAPLATPVPALVLSGELDPVTPPRYGEAVVPHLPNGRHLVLAGQGHGTLAIGCMPRLLARFLDTLDAAELDTTCLDGLRATPPFTGFHGWEP